MLETGFWQLGLVRSDGEESPSMHVCSEPLTKIMLRSFSVERKDECVLLEQRGNRECRKSEKLLII